MKIISRKLLVIFFALFLFLGVGQPAYANNEVNLYLFWSKTCPHCKDEIAFINNIYSDYENLNIYDYELGIRKNALLFQKVGEELKLKIGNVPMTFIGNDYFVGYQDDETTGGTIINLIEKYQKEEDPNVIGRILGSENLSTTIISSPIAASEEEHAGDTKNADHGNGFNVPDEINVPFVGSINIKNLSLPVLTFVIALVDGFNPCAMWVLIFLISMLLGMKNRTKMWILGSAFILASGFVYFLFLTAWLNLFLFLGFVFWVRIVIGVIAMVMGVYQLRDYWKNKDGACKIEGGEKRRKVFHRIKDIVQTKHFAFALVGIVVLAFAVNLVELVCSAGLPAIYTQVLSLSNLPSWQYYLYILFYIIIFMLDDMVVFAIAMTTLKAFGIESKYARYSRLIGGVVILLIGILMIFKPEILMFA